MEPLITGFETALQPATFFWIVAGVALGYFVGVLPGLGKAAATSIAIPLTFYLPSLAALAFLIGIAKGSTAGSAVSAILMNAPGEPSSAPTAMDGYPLARQGKSKKALKMGLFASVIGDFSTTLLLIFTAASLAQAATLIGPIELTSILLFSLTFIAAASSGSLAKGIISAAIGILVSCIGFEIETATPRLTFGMLELFEGVPLVPVAIGMLAASEMMIQIANRAHLDRQTRLINALDDPKHRRLTLQDWRACFPAILRGTAIGAVVGILPGLGSSVASFLSYGLARKLAKEPSRFGKGALEGVAAAESADNAVVPASFIPLFAIGIPGSVIAAILIGAFVIHGITPGPMIFKEHGDLMNGLYASMLVASIVMLVIGYVGQGIFSQVARISLSKIIPVVLFLCVIGAYLDGGGIFGVKIMIVFGVLGFLARKLDFSFVTFLIGFVIGPSLELSLRQSIALTGGDWTSLGERTIAITFIAATALVVGLTVRHSFSNKNGETS